MTALEDALRRALSGDKAPDPVRDLIARGLAGVSPETPEPTVNTESTTDNTPDPSATALNSPTLEATILAGLTNTEEQ